MIEPAQVGRPGRTAADFLIAHPPSTFSRDLLPKPEDHQGEISSSNDVARNRELARRFFESFVEAIYIVRTNPTLSKRAFAKYRQSKDEKQIEDAYQTLREIVRPKPYPSVDGFKTIIKDASDRIPAARAANPKDFMDTSLLEELDRSGYIDGLYR